MIEKEVTFKKYKKDFDEIMKKKHITRDDLDDKIFYLYTDYHVEKAEVLKQLIKVYMSEILDKYIKNNSIYNKYKIVTYNRQRFIIDEIEYNPIVRKQISPIEIDNCYTIARKYVLSIINPLDAMKVIPLHPSDDLTVITIKDNKPTTTLYQIQEKYKSFLKASVLNKSMIKELCNHIIPNTQISDIYILWEIEKLYMDLLKFEYYPKEQTYDLYRKIELLYDTIAELGFYRNLYELDTYLAYTRAVKEIIGPNIIISVPKEYKLKNLYPKDSDNNSFEYLSNWLNNYVKNSEKKKEEFQKIEDSDINMYYLY